MPPIAACADPALVQVTKSIVGVGVAPTSSATLADGDAVTFAIAVKNVGGESVVVSISDVFDSVFTGVTWTRTGQTGTVTTGSGNITNNTQTLATGQQITYLAEATYEPDVCTSLTANVVTATITDANACCGDNVRSAVVTVLNADGPSPKVNPAEGATAMELLYFLLEGVSLPDAVVIAKFINSCGSLADLITGLTAGGTPDGPAVQMTDAFGDPIPGMFAETSIGV